MIRNLIYHFYPEKSKFDFHYSYLNKYKSLFNGKRIICLSLTDKDNVYKLNDIKDKFNDFQLETIDNNVDARETKSLFNILLPKIINEPGITFFGHSKSNSDKRLQPEYLKIYSLWAHHLYTSNLDDINTVDQIMNTYNTCGPFIRTTNLSVIPSAKWHYSGTMYWLKNQSLKDNINKIKEYEYKFSMNRYGAEGFPGSIFNQDEAYCLFNIDGDLGVPNDSNVLLNY